MTLAARVPKQAHFQTAVPATFTPLVTVHEMERTELLSFNTRHRGESMSSGSEGGDGGKARKEASTRRCTVSRFVSRRTLRLSCGAIHLAAAAFQQKKHTNSDPQKKQNEGAFYFYLPFIRCPALTCFLLRVQQQKQSAGPKQIPCFRITTLCAVSS